MIEAASAVADQARVNEVLGHANRVHALLERAGRTEAATRLANEAHQWRDDTTTVVVAGDIKRGKSSLINALIDRPSLLPVDADVATAVHLVVSHGDSPSVEVITTDGESMSVGFDELATYASMAGEAAALGQVGTVEVRIDHPLLARGLRIVDTPGVGGMTQGHRDITMAALGRADVLLFAVSMQEPVARSELEFLADASERIGNVVLVGTRADLVPAATNEATAADLDHRLRTLADISERESASPARAPGDAADDRQAGRARAQRLRRVADQPLVPTSAHLAAQAQRRAESGRAERAAEFRRQSGIDDLLQRLDRTVEARTHIRLVNLLQLVSSLVAGLEDQADLERRAAGGDSSVEAEITARQAQLEQAASKQARWRSTLGTSMSRMQAKAARDVTRELGLVRDHYRSLLDHTEDPAGLEAIRAQLQQSLHAAWATLVDRVTGQSNEVIAELLTDLEIEGESDLFGHFETPTTMHAPGRGQTPGSDTGNVDVLQDVLPAAMQTFMFGNISNVLLGALGVATGGLGVLAFGIGAAVSMPIASMRRKQRAQQQATNELQREIGEALFGQEGIAREFTTELGLRILDAREQLEELIERRLHDRRGELDQRHRELQELLRSEKTAQVEAQRAAEQASENLRTVRDTTDRLERTVTDELAELTMAM